MVQLSDLTHPAFALFQEVYQPLGLLEKERALQFQKVPHLLPSCSAQFSTFAGFHKVVSRYACKGRSPWLLREYWDATDNLMLESFLPPPAARVCTPGSH